ncbi:MAG TPA: gamma-glutamyltransferase family protein [Thermomicrobiales bacterium]|nr:gamma-glutamyltransferase family protein [Thermomicrobiales bacterium]
MPSTTAPTAMIATPHHVASTIGVDVLLEGGTAADAAIAANAALTVLLPDQTSIGGDCFFQIWEPGEEGPLGFNGSGRSAAAANADVVRNAGFSGMPRRGPWTVTVPGTIDAWHQAHRRYGSLPMERLLEPAIELARHGFEISPRLSAAIAAEVNDLAQSPLTAAIYLDGGFAPQPGFWLVNGGLADTLERIAREGRSAFYRGEVAAAIVEAVGGGDGWMTVEDLATHRGEWVTPVESRYRDATVWELPPNSQGVTAQIGLEMMERMPFPGTWDDPAWLHVEIEAKKRAFSIRDRYMSDPAAMTVDVQAYLDAGTIDQLWAEFTPAMATTGQVTLPGDTIYLAVVDETGLMVSLIQSIYSGFGSAVIAGETGVLLQNRGSYFSLVPGHANELAGGKRTLHTLMPGMIEIPGRFRGPFGTQGGDAQAQVHMQLVSHLVDSGATPGEAIARPRWVSGDARLDPFTVVVEAGMEWHVIAGLQERGHQVAQVEPGWPHAGYAQMVLRQPETGELVGAADPRAEGSVEGY